MSHPDQLVDRTGVTPVRQFSHVRIANPNHARFGQSGTVIRIAGGRVWVNFPGGAVSPASARSVEVITPQPGSMIQ